LPIKEAFVLSVSRAVFESHVMSGFWMKQQLGTPNALNLRLLRFSRIHLGKGASHETLWGDFIAVVLTEAHPEKGEDISWLNPITTM
jgi:hypothetical protein